MVVSFVYIFRERGWIVRDDSQNIYIRKENHVWKEYYTVGSNNVLIEKDLLYSEIGIANRSTVIENISNDNLKNATHKVKLTKTRSNSVSIWLIAFERIEIKISAFSRFLARQLAILVHSSKFQICSICIEQQSTLLR